MKVILANPLYKQDISRKYEKYYIRSGTRWPHSGVKLKNTRPHYLPFPFFLAYAASLLKENGFDVNVIDAVALDISEDLFLEKVKIINPDIVFYEVTTPTIVNDLSLASKIKKMINTKVIIAGTHASFFSAQIFKENNFIDYILRGEYEWSLLELLMAIREKRPNFPSGAVFNNNGNIIDTGYSYPIEPLDRLIPPLREIFPSNDNPDPTVYWDGFCQRRPLIQMQSSRGCLNNCYFCLTKPVFYNAGRYRSFSTERVIEEMQDVVHKYKAREIYFDDDDFAAGKNRLFSFCREIIDRSISIKWSCMGNVENLSTEVIKIMAQSGCIGIKFGVESGSEKILKTIGKPVNLNRVKSIVENCNKYGIKTHATFSIGHKQETARDITESTKFIESLGADSIQVSILTPYPGTRYYAELDERGLLDRAAYLQYDGKAAGIFKVSNLKYIREKIVLRWFLKRLFSPLWLIKHSKIIMRTIFGLGIFSFIKQIIQIAIDESKNK